MLQRNKAKKIGSIVYMPGVWAPGELRRHFLVRDVGVIPDAEGAEGLGAGHSGLESDGFVYVYALRGTGGTTI